MATADARDRLLKRGIWLSVAVLIWNILEGLIAVTAGIIANSVALISFGFDSSIEVSSAVVVTWRLWRELRGQDPKSVERLERRSARIAGALLLTLACYVVVDAGRRLLGWGAAAETSIVGIGLVALSLVAMPLLGWAKLSTASQLGSRSFRADAYETIACAWLSLCALAGLVLNAIFAWSWADPLAALLIVPLVVREGLEAWEFEKDSEAPPADH